MVLLARCGPCQRGAHERHYEVIQAVPDGIVCYADLLAHHAGIDLAAAVIGKFDQVSRAQGFPERLGGS